MHSDDIVVRANELRGLVRALFQKVGVPERDADTVAEILVGTDLRGVFSHGTRLAPQYVQHILDGHMQARPQPRVERETPAMAVIDADRGLGHLAARDAMQRAIDKARAVGVGMVSVRHSHHFGAASMYAIQAVAQGMIGFATTSTGGPSVAPYGGRAGAMANHPLAWAFPTPGPFPVVVDIAVGVAAWQRIETMRLYGRQLPPGWCLDREGNPTEDPAQAWIMFPAGGTRGYGLGLVAAVLGGILSGGESPSRRDRYNAATDSEHTLLALSVEHFVPRAQFLQEIGETVAACQRTPPLEGFDRVRVPGELEWENQTKWASQGIPLHREHLARLAGIAERIGVPVPW